MRDNCDLLILPPGWAEQLAGRPNVRLRASFVACLDNPLSWSEAARSAILDEARKKTGAAGIALVGHPNRLDPEYWYRELIRELSHDVPLHAALWEAGRRAGVIPHCLGFSRLPRQTPHPVRRRAAGPAVGFALSSDTEYWSGTVGPKTLRLETGWHKCASEHSILKWIWSAYRPGLRRGWPVHGRCSSASLDSGRHCPP